MKELLLEFNKTVNDAGGVLGPAKEKKLRERYREILRKADTQCPPPDESLRKKGQRGRLRRTKSRNLLERLRNFEEDVLRFMVAKEVPFTNNQGENDLRMTKVHQKVSGCFRSSVGANIFCRIRSYISTCRKHGVSSSDALRLLFRGEHPEFMREGT